MKDAGPIDGLWSSADVARALRVGVSSVKRWTEGGLLPSLKTPGGHRRYSIEAVAAFARDRGLSLRPSPARRPLTRRTRSISTLQRELMASLKSGDKGGVIRVFEERGRLSRASFLDRVISPVLERIGSEWSGGSWSVAEEHRATYLLGEVIDALRPSSAASGAKSAMLAAAADDLHDLPLHMVRLLLEDRGWRVDYLGAAVPWNSLRELVSQRRPVLLLLTARSADAFRGEEFRGVLRECRRVGARVGVGGWWARGGRGQEREMLRFRTLRGFERWLHSAAAAK